MSVNDLIYLNAVLFCKAQWQEAGAVILNSPFIIRAGGY